MNFSDFSPRPQWISGAMKDGTGAAPCLSRRFTLAAEPEKAVFEVAVAGWHEVRVNGRRIGDELLSPTICQPDERVLSVRHDVTAALREGENEIEVLLGSGIFHNKPEDCWNFFKAPWNAAPKIRGALVADGVAVIVTDGSWTAFDSPIVFEALRLGETYDARVEGTHPNERPATVEKYSPRGVVSEDGAAPCRAFESFEPVKQLAGPDGSTVFDFGANIAGWCEIEVEGPAGSKVTVVCDEKLKADGSLDGAIANLVKPHPTQPFQGDIYILAGRDGGEQWHPRFTYHGFRYASVRADGGARLLSIRSRFVHSDFANAGSLLTSDADFTRLQKATLRSYFSNFVGIPTDCPHREKNGWTGDAQLAMETGLWNFDGRRGYEHFLQILLDAQAPNGAVPCVAPCNPLFGFFWGSGPAWDAILFEIPWQLYRFYGDDAPARRAWDAMKRYLDFIATKEDADGLVDYGLGDWCASKGSIEPSVRLTDSAYCYGFNRRAAFWARHFGEDADATCFDAKADAIRDAFNKAFYKGDGLYENGGLTSLAAPLYFKGLCVEGEEQAVAANLVAKVRENGHKAFFGIQGAKWVPRALADNGYANDAWRIFVQHEKPGYMWPLDQGADTLWETLETPEFSCNHIMFGDLSAWAYEYAAGIMPSMERPGFDAVSFRPHFLEGVDSFEATYRCRHGVIRAAWRREGGGPVFEYSVPPGVSVTDVSAEKQ